MYDLILPFPARAKEPVFDVIRAASGSLTYTNATWTLTSNAGALVESGTVDGASGTGTAAITIYKNVDGPDLALAPGLYILHFEPSVEGVPDTVARIKPYEVILMVPGPVVHTIYPTAADLQVFLTGAKILSNPPANTQKLIDLDQAIAQAIATWEIETRYKPFLAETGDSTLYYNSEGGVTDLQGGYVSISSVVVNTVAKVGNQDFRPEPINAIQKGEPYTRLNWGFINGIFPQFSGTFPIFTGVEFPQPGQVGAVAVTGKRGYANPLPADAWQSVLNLGGAQMIPSLEIAQTGGAISVEELDEKVTFWQGGRGPYSDIGERWAGEALRSARGKYRRFVLG